MGAPFDYDDLVLEFVGSSRKYPFITELDCGHANPMLNFAELTNVAIHVKKDFDTSFQVTSPMVTP